jgi:adenosylmethionine-8-amino-7-oxononanoate aminotransferase
MIPHQRELDFKHLWHPYTNVRTLHDQPYVSFERGEGIYLYTQDGKALMDGFSSWWCVALGHSHPHIVEAIREQATTLQQCMLGGVSHPQAVALAHRLAMIAPGGLSRSYYAADGSSAAEAALKMAVQYWRNVGQPRRTRFVGLEHGYHGDTLGAMGVGFTGWFQEPFRDIVRPGIHVPSPHCMSSDPVESEAHATKAFEAMAALVDQHHQEIAAVVVEPLCQGAAGVWIHPESYLQKVRALCDEYGLLLIADEIAVGFGRTGSMFACERAGIVPDIMCLGKAITGGYLPLSVTMATDKIYESFVSGSGDAVFWDGHTFCGNPLTISAALAALDVFDRDDLPNSCAPLENILARGFKEMEYYPCVAYQKTLGTIAMVAFTAESGGEAMADRVAMEAMNHGLFIRPLESSLYLWPPLTTKPEELEEMVHAFQQSIEIVMSKDNQKHSVTL